MRRYGFAAVQRSRRAMGQTVRSNPAARAMMRTELRVMNAVPPLKRWAFRGFGDA
jgi:salicylate hydroxylase